MIVSAFQSDAGQVQIPFSHILIVTRSGVGAIRAGEGEYVDIAGGFGPDMVSSVPLSRVLVVLFRFGNGICCSINSIQQATAPICSWT
jgi:hypothetical protein